MTPALARLVKAAQRYVQRKGHLPGHDCELCQALAAVAQAGSSQNIPTVFPTGSMGDSTQAPENAAVAQAGSVGPWKSPQNAPDYYAETPYEAALRVLADAREAIRLAKEMLDEVDDSTLAHLWPERIDNWKALPAVQAALEEKR